MAKETEIRRDIKSGRILGNLIFGSLFKWRGAVHSVFHSLPHSSVPYILSFYTLMES
jgi:hypothetical protein